MEIGIAVVIIVLFFGIFALLSDFKTKIVRPDKDLSNIWKDRIPSQKIEVEIEIPEVVEDIIEPIIEEVVSEPTEEIKPKLKPKRIRKPRIETVIESVVEPIIEIVTEPVVEPIIEKPKRVRQVSKPKVKIEVEETPIIKQEKIVETVVEPVPVQIIEEPVVEQLVEKPKQEQKIVVNQYVDIIDESYMNFKDLSYSNILNNDEKKVLNGFTEISSMVNYVLCFHKGSIYYQSQNLSQSQLEIYVTMFNYNKLEMKEYLYVKNTIGVNNLYKMVLVQGDKISIGYSKDIIQ